MDIQLIALFTAPATALIALIYGAFLVKRTLKEEEGSEKLKQIGKAVVSFVVFLVMLFVVIMIVMRISPNPTDDEESKSSGKKITSFEEDLVQQAQQLYNQQKNKNKDFTNGPCVSDSLASNWVVDIAHDPRQAIDDLPENQCPAFISGKIKHFIELDPEGNLIRIQ